MCTVVGRHLPRRGAPTHPPVPAPCNRALGCLESQCSLCQHNSKRRCTVNFCRKVCVHCSARAGTATALQCVLTCRCVGCQQAQAHCITPHMSHCATTTVPGQRPHAGGVWRPDSRGADRQGHRGRGGAGPARAPPGGARLGALCWRAASCRFVVCTCVHGMAWLRGPRAWTLPASAPNTHTDTLCHPTPPTLPTTRTDNAHRQRAPTTPPSTDVCAQRGLLRPAVPGRVSRA
jgi:hypothetical protein